ncbi:MAG: DUF2948 family protein [Methyloceanibacter sp.]|uniref:DUF2948 family protein n=1 Tax=Methyloceanibacter sp. TaxID=1965321 RepID=UPI003D6D3CC4
MTPLKLLALDEEDLAVVSSHLQDAVVRVGDLAYLPSQKRFAAVLNRFDWEGVGEGTKDYRRRRTALRFDRVLAAQHKDLRPDFKDRVLSLLAISFEAEDPPSGNITLLFSGDVTIQLKVECLEVELRDLGPAWPTSRKPEHPGDGAAGGESPGASGT